MDLLAEIARLAQGFAQAHPNAATCYALGLFFGMRRMFAAIRDARRYGSPCAGRCSGAAAIVLLGQLLAWLGTVGLDGVMSQIRLV